MIAENAADAQHTDALYVISVAAALSGIHPQTLRGYERRGLLSPFRTQGGTRRYSDSDLRQVTRIQSLAGQGISIEGVKQILSLEDNNRRLRSQVRRLEEKLSDVEHAVRGRGVCGSGYELVVRSEMMLGYPFISG